jgi:hypothetical protein
MRAYTQPRPDLLRIRLIVAGTDELRAAPNGHTLGLWERRTIAAVAVDAALSERRGSEQGK